MEIELNYKVVVKKYKNQVIIGNCRNGKWIRIDEKTYHELQDTVNKLQKSPDYSTIKIEIPSHIKKLISILIDIGVYVKCKDDVKLSLLSIAITRKCNLFCKHCIVSADYKQIEELSLNDIKRLIKSVKNLKHLVITGGEPLVHRHFKEIVDFALSMNLEKLELMTNAVLINDKNIDYIRNSFNRISISLDAASDDTCKIMRGPNVFEHTLEVIKNLKKMNHKDISLSFTVTPDNYHEENKFNQLCYDLDVKPLIRNLSLLGRAVVYMDEDLIYNRPNDKLPSWTKEEYAKFRKTLSLRHKCIAPFNVMHVEYDGYIYPCAVAADKEEFRLGHISTVDSLDRLKENIMENEAYFKFINYQAKSECKECPVEPFCLGCVNDAIELQIDHRKMEEACGDMKKHLIKAVWES